MTTFPVNEIFLSLQGEGHHAGSLAVFVRFAGCNLRCARDNEAGFDCDTEFIARQPMLAVEILTVVESLWPRYGTRPRVILTGGEPMLHVTEPLLRLLLDQCDVAIETNGTQEMPKVDHPRPIWVSCSPKTAEHTLKVGPVNELRYVRHVGQSIPLPTLPAEHVFLSPAWVEFDDEATRRNIKHCIDLVKLNPPWRLSVQQHKLWGVR